jgi:uncharacterized delta-60 repeat protein
MFSGSMLVRLTAAGAPDTTFDGDGIARFADIATPGGVALQPDGRIVSTGSAGAYSASHDFVVARHDADGSLDASFAGDGARTTEFAGAGGDEAAALAVASDGGVVAAGTSDGDGDFFTAGAGDLVIARFGPGGSPDATFSGDGVLTDDRVHVAGGVALAADGAIVAAGAADGDFAVARYGAAGAPDPSFGDDGLASIDFGGFGDRATAVALGAGGRIVVVGSGSNGPHPTGGEDFALARVNADGSPDTSFSGDGRQLTDSGSAVDEARAVAVAGDGRIVVAGSIGTNATSDVAVLRYDADGALDTSFSGDGIQTTTSAASTAAAPSRCSRTAGSSSPERRARARAATSRSRG